MCIRDRYYSLHTAEPDGTGSNEMSGGGYARQAVGPAQFTATGGVGDNDGAINWSDIQTIPTHFGIFDQATGGSFLGWGSISPAITGFTAGSTIQFPAGDLDLTISTS